MQILNCVILKDKYKPLEHKKGLWFLHWLAEPMENEEDMITCRYCALRYRPSEEQIKNIIESDINSQTDEKILSGYLFDDKTVYLTIENQFNYKSAYDLAILNSEDILPVTFKLGDGEYHTFETIENLKEFYIGVVRHIQSCLQEGWEKKKNINYNLYNYA